MITRERKIELLEMMKSELIKDTVPYGLCFYPKKLKDKRLITQKEFDYLHNLIINGRPKHNLPYSCWYWNIDDKKHRYTWLNYRINKLKNGKEID